MRTFNFWEKLKCTFKIYGIWPQALVIGTSLSEAHTSGLYCGSVLTYKVLWYRLGIMGFI